MRDTAAGVTSAIRMRRLSCRFFIMQSQLIDQASKKIKVPQVLINIISRRVRQLSQGHRPLIEAPPGSGFSDIALMEVIAGKISFEATPGFNAEPLLPRNNDPRGSPTQSRSA